MSDSDSKKPMFNPMPPVDLDMPPLVDYRQEHRTSSLQRDAKENEKVGEILANFQLN